MKLKVVTVLAGMTLAALFAATVQADVHVGIGIGVAPPVYVPPPVYSPPPPEYYSPPPPVYYGPGVIYGEPDWEYGGAGYRDHRWHGQRWGRDHDRGDHHDDHGDHHGH